MMPKISNYIFGLSPKRLAIYLILGPLLLFLVHAISTITFKTISGTSEANGLFLNMVLSVLFLFLAAFVLLALFWLRSTVFSVNELELGMPTKWFDIALLVFVTYLLINLCSPLFEYVPEEYRHLFYAAREIISFAGLLIAYPLLCYYVARAIAAKKSGKPATVISALPYALVLLFGTVLGIPFFHRYVSNKTSTNSEIVVVYGISFGLCITIFVIGFIATITGLV